MVDGVQIGGTQTATSLHSGGADDTLTVLGTWAAGPHTLTVTFLNDAWGGTPSTDRNLYVDGVSLNGTAVSGGTAALLGTGPHGFSFTGSVPPSTTIGSGSESLVLKISQDAYLGDAQYTIMVDGVQIGGTQTATSLHSSGADDTLTVLGGWAAGSHTLTVTFLNDAWGGTPSTDRNLYVDGVSLNGTAVSGGTAALLGTGPHGFSFSSGLGSSNITIGGVAVMLNDSMPIGTLGGAAAVTASTTSNLSDTVSTSSGLNAPVSALLALPTL